MAVHRFCIAHISAVTVTVLTGGSPRLVCGITVRRVKHGQVIEARIFTSVGLSQHPQAS